MRSLGFTLILALVAAAVCAVAVWQWREGNFDSVFGAPPTPAGQRIYQSFTPDQVRHIRITSNGVTATFALKENGWQASTPWTDRMDPRAAVGIINFTLGMRVEDVARLDEIDPAKAGLAETAVNIRLENSDHKPLANFKLGRPAPWKAEFKDIEEPQPTVFVQPRDKDHKRHVYVATGDINPWFKDGFKFLRDHRPFYFNPVTLQKIRIRSQQGDLTLARPVSESITAPNPLQEIRNRFLTADTDGDSLVSRAEWLAMKDYNLDDALKHQKFDSADSNRNQQLSPDEFTNAFLGAWRIIKPLDLPTDPVAMKTLLEGIFELHATKVSDRTAVTLPAGDTAVKTEQIALVTFGSETETLLEIFPPETPEANDTKATVSNRPDTVFDLPLKPDTGLVSLANLPREVNELRDPTLTHLNIQALRGISIQPSTGTEILISREPPQPWMATVNGVSAEANEENLYALLKAVTTSRAIGFESDAATDFTPWGLHRPILTLRFIGQDNQGLELRFGIDGKGGFFVNRTGTPTVMRVDESLVSSIAVRPFQWRLSRLWSVDRVNLVGIKHIRGTESPLILKYQFNPEGWQAERDGKDLSDSLDPTSANYMLSILEGLKVSRWLSATDENALAALKNPSLSLTVTEFTTDDQGENTGIMDRTVTFAPASPGDNPGFYYGRLDKDPNPFLLDRDTYQKIAIGLFEK
jgi:hypothetical protein